ncbi:hypothetical protein D3C76_1728610 [compost metagenome]
MIKSQLFHLRDDAIQRLARKPVAIERNQQSVRRHQGAEGVEIQRRRCVDVDALVVLGQFHQQLAQLVDLELALQL